MCRSYIEQLFEDERLRSNLESIEVNVVNKNEVLYALKIYKTKKTQGSDQLPVEILKLIDEDQIHILLELFNTIYRRGIIPSEWLLSTFVALSKKTNAKRCSDYRTISLMTHTLNVSYLYNVNDVKRGIKLNKTSGTTR